MNKNPYHLTTKELLYYLLNYKYTSISQQNQIISSIKLFYKYILDKRDIHLDKIERPNKERHLPRIIDTNELIKKINNISNIKHQTIYPIPLGYNWTMHNDYSKQMIKMYPEKKTHFMTFVIF